MKKREGLTAPGEHSGQTPVERQVRRAGLLRPRIVLPELPKPTPKTEKPPASMLDEEGTFDFGGEDEGDQNPPSEPENYKPAQIKIPK